MPSNTEFIGPRSPRFAHLRNDTFFFILMLLSLILLGLLLSQLFSPILVFSTLSLIVACAVVPARWPFGAFLILTVASVMPRAKVDLGGWNARPEHYAALLVLVILLLRSMFIEKLNITLTNTDYWVIAYVACNYVSSAFMSPDPKLTLRWALLANFVVLPYFLIRFLVNSQRTLCLVFRVFLGVGIVECLYALICFSSRYLMSTSFGVEVGQYAAGFEGVYGTQYEPNILGSFSACLAVMFLVLSFTINRRVNWIIAGIVVAVASLLFSLSRAAFIGFVFTSVLILFLGVRSGSVKIQKLLPIGLTVVLFVAPLAATGGKNLLTRFANLSEDQVQNDVETMGRLISWTVALQGILQHPILGNGTASFQLLAGSKEVPILGEQPWIANSVVRIVHDTGLIGLLLFCAVALTLVKKIRIVVKGGQVVESNIVGALAAGCLVYAVAFMSADGTMLSFFWVHMGLLTSACSLSNLKPADLSSRTSVLIS